jgi:hypothetical protein
VQPLQSINCLDSHIHGHEWHGRFTRLVGTWLVGFGCVIMFQWFGLATSGMPMSSVWFGYWCDSCELEALCYSWVTWEQIHHSDYDAQ